MSNKCSHFKKKIYEEFASGVYKFTNNTPLHHCVTQINKEYLAIYFSKSKLLLIIEKNFVTIK